MGLETSRSSGASGDDNLLKLRLSNVTETQKRIQHLFVLIYLLFLLVFLTWYNVNFEGSRLEEDIERLEKALKIEMLKPWDDFLERTASCFHDYFLELGKGGVVTQADLREYIERYESENRKPMGLVGAGIQRPWPVNKMRDLLDSEQHWQDCAFWAQQDTLVSFLFSLNSYLTRYFIKRLPAVYDGTLEEFWASTDSINAAVDSILYSLYTRVDSLIKPFKILVTFGWNPFHDRTSTTTLSGRHGTFDDYGHFDLNELLSKLQRLNYVSRFKKEVTKHSDILLRVQGDLENILTRTANRDSISFSRKETDIQFHDLSTILRSQLLVSPGLPDSIQLPQVSNLTYADLDEKEIGKELLEAYFPTYLQVLKEYKIDKVGGVKKRRDDLVSQRGSEKQKIQVLGAEISSRSILYFLPFICWALYFLAFLFIRHLRNLLQSDQRRPQVVPEVSTLAAEALKAPLLVLVRPILLGLLLISLPALGTIIILGHQLISAGERGIVLNPYVVTVIGLLFAIVISFVCRHAILLQKVARDRWPDSPEILEKKQKSDLDKHVEGAESSEPS